MSPPVAGSDVRHSSHVCLPFETDDEKHEATVAFIHEGYVTTLKVSASGFAPPIARSLTLNSSK